jgi:hypothetical protein
VVGAGVEGEESAGTELEEKAAFCGVGCQRIDGRGGELLLLKGMRAPVRVYTG